MASRIACREAASQLRPVSRLTSRFTVNPFTATGVTGTSNVSTRRLHATANPPMLPLAPPMTMIWNYIGMAVVLGVGIWSVTRSREEYIKDGFIGIFDGQVPIDGSDLDDEDDDFADILGPQVKVGTKAAGEAKDSEARPEDSAAYVPPPGKR